MKYVFLLHGFGENAGIWDTLKAMLPEEYVYITPDYSKITFCQSIEEYADWLHTEVEERNIHRFVLIGHSMGGYISLAYAKKYGKYLSGLGLFHSTAYADTEDKKDKRDKTIAFLEKHDSAKFIDGFLPEMYSEQFRKKNAVYIEKLSADNRLIPAEALITATKAMKNRLDQTAVLKGANYPLLSIIGKLDNFIPYSDALAQLGLMANPFVAILGHVAHAGMMEAPHVSASIITDFLAAAFD